MSTFSEYFSTPSYLETKSYSLKPKSLSLPNYYPQNIACPRFSQGWTSLPTVVFFRDLYLEQLLLSVDLKHQSAALNGKKHAVCYKSLSSLTALIPLSEPNVIWAPLNFWLMITTHIFKNTFFQFAIMKSTSVMHQNVIKSLCKNNFAKVK